MAMLKLIQLVLLGTTFVFTGAATCANGKGMLSPYDPSACCPTSCGYCGGDGCHLRTGGADNCCGKVIITTNKECGDPPCVVSTTGTSTPNSCLEGQGILNGDGTVCCPTKCGYCGGEGCHERFPGSENECCKSRIDRSNRSCFNGVGPPCYFSTAPPPDPDVPYDPNNVYSCTPKCINGDVCAGTNTDTRNYQCRTPVTCPTGQAACGKGGDMGGSLYVDYFCCRTDEVCVYGGGLGGGATYCLADFVCGPDTCNGNGECVDKDVWRLADYPKAFDKCICSAGYSGRFCEVSA